MLFINNFKGQNLRPKKTYLTQPSCRINCIHFAIIPVVGNMV